MTKVMLFSCALCTLLVCETSTLCNWCVDWEIRPLGLTVQRKGLNPRDTLGVFSCSESDGSVKATKQMRQTVDPLAHDKSFEIVAQK